MTKQEFKDFCRQEFYKRGFKKVKNMYYFDGESDCYSADCGNGM